MRTFVALKRFGSFLLGVWFGGNAEEHEARGQKDWVKQDRRQASSVPLGIRKCQRLFIPPLEFRFILGHPAHQSPKHCAHAGQDGDLASLPENVLTSQPLHWSSSSPESSQSEPPCKDLKFLCVTKATGTGPSPMGLELRQS